MNDRLKIWKCEYCGNVLGVIVSDTSRVERLDVFRQEHTDRDVLIIERISPVERAGLYSVRQLEQGVVECKQCGMERVWRLSPRGRRVLICKS